MSDDRKILELLHDSAWPKAISPTGYVRPSIREAGLRCAEVTNEVVPEGFFRIAPDRAPEAGSPRRWSEKFDVIVNDGIFREGSEPRAALRQTLDFLKPGGTIYTRYCPWYSRAGGPESLSLDKAFAHLALRPSERRQD